MQMIRPLSDAAKMFLFSVVPLIAIVVTLSLNFWPGSIPARNLLFGLIALVSVWFVGAIWGYADWRIRKFRRRKKQVANCKSGNRSNNNQ